MSPARRCQLARAGPSPAKVTRSGRRIAACVPGSASRRYAAALQPIHPADEDEVPWIAVAPRGKQPRRHGDDLGVRAQVRRVPHAAARRPMPRELAAHVLGMRHHGSVLRQQGVSRVLPGVVTGHRQGTEAAAPPWIEQRQARRSKDTVAGLNERQTVGLLAGDAGAVVGVREQHRRRGLEQAPLEVRVQQAVNVDDVGSPGANPIERAVARERQRHAALGQRNGCTVGGLVRFEGEGEVVAPCREERHHAAEICLGTSHAAPGPVGKQDSHSIVNDRSTAAPAQALLKDTCGAAIVQPVRPLPHLLLWALGLRAAETQTTAEERAALARYAQGRTPIVEIGVWHGVTTAVLRRAMRDGGVLWAVDPFPAGRLGISLQKPMAEAEVRRVRNGTVRWIRATGQAAAAQYQREQREHVSLIFVDGDHSYDGLAGDWFAWKPLVAPGGARLPARQPFDGRPRHQHGGQRQGDERDRAQRPGVRADRTDRLADGGTKASCQFTTATAFRLKPEATQPDLG